MGSLCSKDDTKKKKGEEPAPQQPDAPPPPSQRETAAPSADDNGAAKTSPKEDPQPASGGKELTELFSGAIAQLAAQNDETDSVYGVHSTPPPNRSRHDRESRQQGADTRETSINTRNDLFPETQDKALNMNIGKDKYSDLRVMTSSDEDNDGEPSEGQFHSMQSSSYQQSGKRQQRATPERRGVDPYSYNPANFHDEDTSVVEHNSEAFETPREHFTESMSRLSPSNFAANEFNSYDQGRQPPVASALRGSPPPPPPAETVKQPAAPPPHAEAYARHGSAVSGSSFTVTMVRNNNRMLHTPNNSSPALADAPSSRSRAYPPLQQGSPYSGAAAMSEASTDPYGKGEAFFYSCRSDATLSTASNARPAGAKHQGGVAATDGAFYSCRSLESLSSQSVAALRLPRRRVNGDDATPSQALVVPANTASANNDTPKRRKKRSGSEGESNRSTPSKQTHTGKAAAAAAPSPAPAKDFNALDAKANVVKTLPATLPLPKPRPGAASTPSPTDSRVTEAAASSSAVGATTRTATAARPKAEVDAGRAGTVADSDMFSAVPPASSAFRSFPPTPSAMEASYSASMSTSQRHGGGREDADSTAFQSAMSPASESTYWSVTGSEGQRQPPPPPVKPHSQVADTPMPTPTKHNGGAGASAAETGSRKVYHQQDSEVDMSSNSHHSDSLPKRPTAIYRDTHPAQPGAAAAKDSHHSSSHPGHPSHHSKASSATSSSLPPRPQSGQHSADRASIEDGAAAPYTAPPPRPQPLSTTASSSSSKHPPHSKHETATKPPASRTETGGSVNGSTNLRSSGLPNRLSSLSDHPQGSSVAPSSVLSTPMHPNQQPESRHSSVDESVDHSSSHPAPQHPSSSTGGRDVINSTGDGASQPEASTLSAEAQFLQMASNVEANHHGEEALYEGLATTSSSSLPADSEDER